MPRKQNAYPVVGLSYALLTLDQKEKETVDAI